MRWAVFLLLPGCFLFQATPPLPPRTPPLLMPPYKQTCSAEVPKHLTLDQKQTVVVEVSLDEWGRVSDQRIITSTLPALNQPTLDALNNPCSFKPGTIERKAVTTVGELIFEFHPGQARSKTKWGRTTLDQWFNVPKPAKRCPATYPTVALKNRVEGKVRLELTIGAAGKVTNVQYLSSLGYGLEAAAADSLQDCPFNPATLDGKPIHARIPYSFVFRVPQR